MEINGKVYRNLEGQVGYLTDKYDDLQNQINDVRAHLTHYVEVDTLPTGDDIDPSAVYLLGPMGTAPDQYYEEWVYVQKADESWVWEKRGDTDSVDLSGYLEKDTSVTTNTQVYAKNPDGTQRMLEATNARTNSAIVVRTGAAQVPVPDTPTEDSHATSKKYVDGNFVAQIKTQGGYARRVYAVFNDGNGVLQGNIPVSSSPDNAVLVYRASAGQLNLPDQSQQAPSDDQAISKRYAGATYLAKQTATSTNGQLYAKTNGGSQAMVDVGSSVVGNMVVARNGNGQILVPTTPTDNAHAASKAYVDAAVGQLLYLHDLEIIVTVDATNYLYVKAYLVNGSATAITSFDRILYKRIDVQWGAYGPDIANCEPCAVTKLPDTFRQDEFDDPFPGFLYQYISGGNLVSGKTDSNMSTTITDTVISF